MFSQQDVEILKAALPPDCRDEIAQEAKVCRMTVYRFLTGQSVKPKTQRLIYMAALTVIERAKNKTNEIRYLRSKLLNNNNDHYND